MTRHTYDHAAMAGLYPTSDPVDPVHDPAAIKDPVTFLDTPTDDQPIPHWQTAAYRYEARLEKIARIDMTIAAAIAQDTREEEFRSQRRATLQTQCLNLKAEREVLIAKLPAYERAAREEARAAELAETTARYEALKAEEDAVSQRRAELKTLKARMAELAEPIEGGDSA